MKYIFIIFTIFFIYSCQQERERVLISFKIDLPYAKDETGVTELKSDDFDRLENSQLIIEVFPQVDNPKNSLKFKIKRYCNNEIKNDCIEKRSNKECFIPEFNDNKSECIDISLNSNNYLPLDLENRIFKIDRILEMDIYNNSQIYTYIKDERGIYFAARNFITIKEGINEVQALLKFRKIMRFKIEDMENLSVIGYTPFDERIKNDKKRFFVRKAKESKIKDSFLFPVSIRKEVFSDRFNIFFEVKKGDKKGIILPFKILTAEQDKATDITVDNQDITEEASCFRNGENGETGCGREEECASLNAEDMTNNAEDVSNNLDDKCFENQIGTNLMELDRGSYQLNLKYYNKKEIELEENKANLDKIKVSSITITNKYFKPQVGDIYENTTLGSFFLTGYNFNLLSKSDNNKIVRGEIKISYGEIGIYKDVFLSYKGTFILYPLKNAAGVAGWVLQNRFPFYKLCGNYDRGIRECIPYAEEPTFLQEDPKSIKFIEFNGNKIIELYNSER